MLSGLRCLFSLIGGIKIVGNCQGRGLSNDKKPTGVIDDRRSLGRDSVVEAMKNKINIFSEVGEIHSLVSAYMAGEIDEAELVANLKYIKKQIVWPECLGVRGIVQQSLSEFYGKKLKIPLL